MAIDRAAILRNAEKLLRQGKLDDAIAEYVRVVEEQPRDWNTANTLGDLHMRAGHTDKALEQFVRAAEVLNQDGFLPKASAIYKKVLKIRPDDDFALLQAGDIAAKQGLLVAARLHWNAVMAHREARGDAKGVAEMKVRLGNLDAADLEARAGAARARLDTGDKKAGVADLIAVAIEMIDQDRRADGLELLCEALLIDQDNQKARKLLWEAYETPAEAQAASGDWAAAAATLQEFTTRVPNHVQALARLVEVCVDGGLDSTITTAQMQLADAYLASGEPGPALMIAEDLMLREPTPAHVEQLRRALTAMGETDPESVIAARLNLSSEDDEDETPEVAVPVARPSLKPPPVFAAEQPPTPSGVEGRPNVVPFAVPEPVAAKAPPAAPPAPAPPPASARAVNAAPAEPAPAASKPPAAPPAGHAAPLGKSDAVEIDLSDLLMDFKVGQAPAAPVFSNEPPPPLVPDLDEVFELFRDQAERASGGRSDYDRGVQLRDAGRLDESIKAFEAASRVPRYRFDASAALGRIHRERGAPHLALDWLERATHAPAADPGDAHELFYELADLLESIGEVERALAICLELQVDAGEYRDLTARIQRLTKVQARG